MTRARETATVHTQPNTASLECGVDAGFDAGKGRRFVNTDPDHKGPIHRHCFAPWLTYQTDEIEGDTGIRFHCDICRSYMFLSDSTEKEMGRKGIIDGWIAKHQHPYSKQAKALKEGVRRG